MHELSLAEDLVAKCLERARGRRVLTVRVRCSAGVDAEELSVVFPVAAKQHAGRELEQAALELDVVPTHLGCSCGWAGELPEDNIAGHVGICPGCGHPTELSSGLELVGLRFAGDPVEG